MAEKIECSILIISGSGEFSGTPRMLLRMSACGRRGPLEFRSNFRTSGLLFRTLHGPVKYIKQLLAQQSRSGDFTPEGPFQRRPPWYPNRQGKKKKSGGPPRSNKNYCTPRTFFFCSFCEGGWAMRK